MDESQGNSGSLPPFLTKTYEMVDDRSTDNIVSWSATGRSFIVWNQLDFSRDLLPRYFKHNNFSSFIRQLNTYGFRKVDPEQWEFANDDFVRGQPHLLKNIHRRKPVHSHSLQNLQAQGNAASLTESERQSLKDNIERLTKERESLCLELQRHEQEREEYESKMKLCKDHLQHLQCRQKNLESLVSRVLQRPGLSLNLVPQLEIHDRKRRLRIGYLYEEAGAGDNLVGKTQASTRENGDESSVPSSNIELIEQLESSLAFWESMVHDMSQCAEEDLALEYEPTHHAESPARSGIQLNVDIQPKSSGIDMNSEPPAAPIPKLALASSTEQAVGTTASAPTGVNDVFWEQFLTENPGSSETQEVQSERKDSDGRKSDSRPGDHHNLWCNLGNNLAGPMGHLTQAERT